MRLKEQLILPQSRIVSVKIGLGAEEHTVTLELQAALTTSVAEAFGCRELIFAGNVPRSGVKKMEIEGEESDSEIRLEHPNQVFQTVVSEMGHYVAKFEGTGPQLNFKVKFSGYVITIAELIEHVKVDPIEVTLKPAQMNLDLQKKTEGDDPGLENPVEGEEEPAEESDFMEELVTEKVQ